MVRCFKFFFAGFVFATFLIIGIILLGPPLIFLLGLTVLAIEWVMGRATAPVQEMFRSLTPILTDGFGQAYSQLSLPLFLATGIICTLFIFLLYALGDSEIRGVMDA